MREVASLASAYGRQQLPASLMQRLELMQHLALAAQPNAQPIRPRRSLRRGAHAIVLAWFSLGVIASGALGVGSVVAIRAQAAGQTPFASIAALASMDRAAWAKVPAGPVVPQDAPAWDTVQLALGRADRVPLPLQVTGAEGADFEVVLDGLPAGVRPSRGSRRGPAWVLRQGDLDGLFLTLADAAPAAFDVRIALSAPATVATAGSIVKVRLSDPPGHRHAAAAGRPEATHAVPAYAGTSKGPQAGSASPASSEKLGAARSDIAAAQGGEKAKAHRDGPDSAKRRTAAASETAGRRVWPEGASGLGAVSREPDGPSWWQMPPPSWSPFVVGQERP